jgi:hypothetical protein
MPLLFAYSSTSFSWSEVKHTGIVLLFSLMPKIRLCKIITLSQKTIASHFQILSKMHEISLTNADVLNLEAGEAAITAHKKKMDYVFYSHPLQNTRQQLSTVKNIIIPWFKQADRDDDMGGTLLLSSLCSHCYKRGRRIFIIHRHIAKLSIVSKSKRKLA